MAQGVIYILTNPSFPEYVKKQIFISFRQQIGRRYAVNGKRQVY